VGSRQRIVPERASLDAFVGLLMVEAATRDDDACM
jgi:hypothetical protein